MFIEWRTIDYQTNFCTLSFVKEKEGRKRGRPNLRVKDVMKRNMKSKNINTNTWQNTAQDKPAWRNTINNAT